MKKIAIQGISGCFHEMAARKHFGEEVEMVECDSFRKVCSALNTGVADLAVMAIENTLAGSILPNYSLIQKNHFFIIGEVYLKIQMNLMALPGIAFQEIRKVISHPVALAQCEDFLETNMEKAELKEFHDTAAAAKHIFDEKLTKTAAIANELSAKMYGLSILERNIQTHKNNYTRFLILSREKVEIPTANKASLSLQTNHTPGSLAKVLNIFSENKVNLTKIQSVPIIGKPYQYAFKIDVEWDNRENYTNSLKLLKQHDTSVQILGEYPKEDYLLAL